MQVPPLFPHAFSFAVTHLLVLSQHPVVHDKGRTRSSSREQLSARRRTDVRTSRSC